MPDPACPICRGCGWRVEERHGISGAARCECTIGDIQRQTLKYSALPALYQNLHIDMYAKTTPQITCFLFGNLCIFLTL